MSGVPAPAPAPGQVPAWPLYRAMVGVGLVCSVLIVAVFHGTRPAIERNRAEALEAAVFRVLPGVVRIERYAQRGDGSFARAAEGEADAVVHAGYDEAGGLVGLAIEASGMGYQDLIRVLYGYSPQAQAIVGFQVLESKETPGLGDRIGSDPAFLRSFERLDVALDAAGALRRPIVAVSRGSQPNPWEIDGITGATISSKAVAAMLDASVRARVPTLLLRRADFERPREPDVAGEGERS